MLRADYALFFKANIPLAVVEAKDNLKLELPPFHRHLVVLTEGVSQAHSGGFSPPPAVRKSLG